MSMTAEQAFILSKKYVEESLIGGGAVKGKNCVIESIEPVTGGHKVKFKWTLDNGTVQSDSFTILDGVDGESAYDIAVSQGYVGTEEEWIASLKGDQGEKGDKGVGIESVTKEGTTGLVDTYLILFADGTTTTYTVTNGANITKVSQLENDSKFITNATIGLINYYLKDEVYSKSKIDELLRNIGAGLSVKIVAELPTEEISGTTIYLINTSGSNYNQYMYIDSAWASLGSTSVDLSSYYNKTQIDTMLLGYITASTLLTQLMSYTKTADLAKVALSNDYNDLDNLPTIPDVSGIKPYVDVVQNSSNTAPTSKVVYDAVEAITGDISDISDAVDEVAENIGDLSSLSTTEKSNLVGAVNEVNVNLGKKADKTGLEGNSIPYPVKWVQGIYCLDRDFEYLDFRVSTETPIKCKFGDVISLTSSKTVDWNALICYDSDMNILGSSELGAKLKYENVAFVRIDYGNVSSGIVTPDDMADSEVYVSSRIYANALANTELAMLGYNVPNDCPIQNIIYGDTFVQNVARVDLGNLNYFINPNPAMNYFETSIADMYSQPIQHEGDVFVYYRGSRYTINPSNYVGDWSDRNISVQGTAIFVTDSAYTDADTFKASVKGGYLYYRLQTPIIKQIDGNEIVEAEEGVVKSVDSDVDGGSSFCRKSGNVVTFSIYARNCTQKTFARIPFAPKKFLSFTGFAGNDIANTSPRLFRITEDGTVSNYHDSNVYKYWLVSGAFII